jgi:hypothetical protein
MSAAEPPGQRGPDPDADPRAERLAALAAWLGVELPLFEGPLVAFQLDGHRGAEDSVFLGGDLHQVHPTAHGPKGGPTTPADRDRTLDSAIVTLSGHDHEMYDVAAVEGVWCMRIDGERLPAAPYFSLTDSVGRIRAWLLLPPPRLMVGIAHFWLPSVPPPEDPRTGGYGLTGIPPGDQDPPPVGGTRS